ncbi:GNAT family N-acetyltransferase [Pontibacter sp. H249]|uniref:GNAT family N-acetyltransferase n=1 Tax=Pontibacter sp. H249 TaxID=3133420 RepID=UPI0030BFD995
MNEKSNLELITTATPMPSSLLQSYSIQKLETLEQMLAQHHLVLQLNPNMAHERYRELLQLMLQNGYKMVAAFDEAGTCVGLSGYWVSAKLYSGKYLEVDNFVVDKDYRSGGVGKLLSDWMLQEAKRLKCDTVMLDAYVTNSAAHRFYFREGFHIKSYHFYKSIGNEQ